MRAEPRRNAGRLRHQKEICQLVGLIRNEKRKELGCAPALGIIGGIGSIRVDGDPAPAESRLEIVGCAVRTAGGGTDVYEKAVALIVEEMANESFFVPLGVNLDAESPLRPLEEVGGLGDASVQVLGLSPKSAAPANIEVATTANRPTANRSRFSARLAIPGMVAQNESPSTTAVSRPSGAASKYGVGVAENGYMAAAAAASRASNFQLASRPRSAARRFGFRPWRAPDLIRHFAYGSRDGVV